jgi:membrane associated rhomboid family serine protease
LRQDRDFDLNEPIAAYVPVRATRSRGQAELWTLVLLSADIPTLTERAAADYVVLVGAARASQAAAELGRFDEENRNWPPPKALPVLAVAGPTRPPTVLLMGGLVVFHLVTGSYGAANAWFRQGAVDSRAILADGEWWRLITALTLHADPVHLLSNIFFGGLVIHFLCKMSGTGTAWLLVLAAGTVANLANVVARGPGHVSVGFSTAVFAAVGLLCGGQIRLLSLRSVLLPLGAGAGLLAMLGSSGQRTDLGAHLWGLVVGLVGGLVWGRLPRESAPGGRRSKQSYLLAAVILVIWLAWSQALAF